MNKPHNIGRLSRNSSVKELQGSADESHPMSIQSLTVEFEDLDWGLIDDTQGLGDEAVSKLVSEFLIEQFRRIGVDARAEVLTNTLISVSWQQEIDTQKALEQCRDRISQGNVQSAAATLWLFIRLESISRDQFLEGMFLLGSAYNLLQRFDEALSVLELTVECAPEHFQAMSSLGYAELANENYHLAEEWFRKSLTIEPRNSWALKNLGVCLTNQRRFADAQVELRKCLEVAPDDIGVLVCLGQCAHHLGELVDAKKYFERVLSLDGPEYIHRMAREYLAKYEADSKRGDEVAFNQVAYEYIVDALERLEVMDSESKRAAIIELVLLAAQGIAVNDLETKRRLRSLEGDFNGLYLACFMYAAVQEVAPGQDMGIDFSREYAKAKATGA